MLEIRKSFCGPLIYDNVTNELVIKAALPKKFP